MATIKGAVQSAMLFAKENLDAERVATVQLEEVESGSYLSGDNAWLITLSMIDTSATFSAFSPVGPRRDYKIFTVLKKNGEVASMKIRELATT
jgi:hypothetical protein